MLDAIPVDDFKSALISRVFRSNMKLFGIAVSMVIIMLLVSLQGWIIDDIVDEIKKDLGVF